MARKIYRLGKEEHGNREVVIGDEDILDLPAEAEYAYSNVQTQFPYAIPA